MNRTLRICIVVLLSAIAIGQVIPEFSRVLGHPLGYYGFATDGAIVTGVDTGSPAEGAGLRTGDVVSLARNSHLTQNSAAQDYSPAAGDRLNVTVLRPHARTLVITSIPEPAGYGPYLVLRETLFIFTVLVGALLLILRPSKSTWALFLYSLGGIAFANAVVNDWMQASPAYSAFVAVQVSIPIFALVWFGVCVGRQRADRFDISMLFAAVILALANFATEIMLDLGYWTYAQDALPSSVIDILYYALPAFAILRAYRRAPKQDGAALQWIIAGLLVAGACIVADTFLYPAYLPYAAHAICSAAPALIFITAAYALLANRIVDLNFVASRALVYGILTSITVGVLALIDWFVAKQLDAVRLGFILELAAALALGVTIQRLHRWSDGVVDKYVFRAAHDAELRLKRLGRALVHSPSREVIDRAVCEDAAQTLSLASAAVFRRDEGDRYVRTASFNWPYDTIAEIDAGHRLPLYLSAEERPILPGDEIAENDCVPEGVARPAIAIPFVVRHQLIGFVLYGSHTSGAQPDSKDVELLAELSARATAAYDHVAMEERTNENRELRSQNMLLRSLLGEVKA